MKYRSGYKYQLAEDYRHPGPVPPRLCPPADVIAPYIHLAQSGTLTVCKGYAWDGASGPTWDTPATMTPSLVHDAFYQLMRLGLVSRDCRETVDQLFYLMLRARGMFGPRAWLWYRAVRRFGPDDGGKPKPVLRAP